MGRRRRKKIVKIYRPKIPKIFTCPVCGSKSLNIIVDKKKMTAKARCPNCGLEWETNIKSYEEKIDIYHRLFDEYIDQME